MPQLRQPLSKRRVEGLTLLLLFFPHRRVRDAAELPWGEWAREGMALWRSCAHNRFWDQGWLCFFSRLAKHDTHVRRPAHCLALAQVEEFFFFFWSRNVARAKGAPRHC